MAKKKKAPYVKNADLRAELIKSKAQDELTLEAIKMFMLMAQKFSLRLHYVYEEDKEDCIAFAIMDCYRYWRGYKPEKSDNAFAYVSQIIKNGYAKGWRKLYGRMPLSSKISISRNNIYSL
jgi:DNA-directed RNA polymerase specialized sigma subunit